MGALYRQWKKQGEAPLLCGLGTAFSFEPDVDGSPTADRDLAYLDHLQRWKRVNLAGTRVTPQAIAAFRAAHPKVAVEDKDDE